MSKRYIKLAVFVLAVLVTLTGCKSSAEKEQGPKPVAVEVKLVERGEVQAGTVLSGPVRAQAEVYVISKLPLQVLAVKVQVGDRVEAGQVLLQLDDKDLAQQVRQARAALAVAEAGLPPAKEESPAAASARLAYENAAADLTRMEYLKEQGVISEQALEQARVRAAGAAAQYQGILDQEKMALANHDQAQAAVALARSQLDNATITAPVAGIVASLPVEVGQMVSPSAPVATIVAMDQVKISLNATEKDISHLRTGQKVTVKVASLGGKEFAGELTAVAPAADARTQGFPVEVTVPNDGHLIKPGMFAEVELQTEVVSAVLVIEREAIVPAGTNQTVFVVKDDIAYQKEIILGLVNDRVAQVTSGLGEGELLVVKGQQYLRDGMPVSVVAGGEAS